MSTEIHKSLVNYAFKTQNMSFHKCLAPQGLGSCANKTIRAHSIQNRKVLDLLQRDGHVVILKTRLDSASGVRVEFDLAGRNRATTFTGLCRDHDQDIFAPIEKNIIDVEDKRHLFLLAYRAVIKQTHATMNSAIQSELLSRKKKVLGLMPNDVLTDEEKQALGLSLNSFQTFLYKTEYDKIFLAQEYNRLCHAVVEIPSPEPSIAVNDLFSPRENVQNHERIERIALNIFPRTEQTVAIFSYLCCDEPFIGVHIDEILESEGDYRHYLLSKLILRYCENFVISPKYFDAISDDSRRAIIEFFISTIVQDRFDYEDRRLYLF